MKQHNQFYKVQLQTINKQIIKRNYKCVTVATRGAYAPPKKKESFKISQSFKALNLFSLTEHQEKTRVSVLEQFEKQINDEIKTLGITYDIFVVFELLYSELV